MTIRFVAAIAALTFGLSGVAQAQLSEAAQAKPTALQTAKYSGGQGATWKTGKDTHAFTGTYGGCRYTGFAGPNGYRLDKVC